MKFKVGDTVQVTAGKDKGKTGTITATQPANNTVIVKDTNIYAKHVKPFNGRAGEIVRQERPLATAKIAIINEKNEVDRIGYKTLKSGEKVRIFKKTGTELPTAKQEKKTK